MSTDTKFTALEKLFCTGTVALAAFTVVGSTAEERSTQHLLDSGYVNVEITGKASLMHCLSILRPTFTAVANGQKVTGYVCWERYGPRVAVTKKQPLSP